MARTCTEVIDSGSPHIADGREMNRFLYIKSVPILL